MSVPLPLQPVYPGVFITMPTQAFTLFKKHITLLKHAKDLLSRAHYGLKCEGICGSLENQRKFH